MPIIKGNRILKLIRDRHSFRVPFDPNRPVAKRDLRQILEAGRWAPTAHNIQNFEIIVIDDKGLLKKIGNIKSPVSEEFIRENYQQLSLFTPSWRDPARLEEAIREGASLSLKETIKDSPVILIVAYDSRKRAPASEGDSLGIMSLGCVMENIMSVFGSNSISANDVEKGVKRVLNIPKYMRIAFAARLGYPVSAPAKHTRVRRDVKAFTHYNRFGNNGLD